MHDSIFKLLWAMMITKNVFVSICQLATCKILLFGKSLFGPRMTETKKEVLFAVLIFLSFLKNLTSFFFILRWWCHDLENKK